jgi:hypothetical protein
MNEEQKQEEIDRRSLIYPERTYMGPQVVVGYTDSSGAFSVQLPGAGTYIITAMFQLSQSRINGSRQPVVVDNGQNVDLGLPIRLLVVSMPGG